MNHFASATSSAPKRENTARPARRRLFGALSTAFAATSLIAGGIAEAALAVSPQPTSLHTAQNWPVQTCQDTTGPGSLRYIAVHAQSGDTIDFSQLPMLCGMVDSTITLTAGEIVLHQPDITLLGPQPGTGTVTLSGGGASRVLRHQTYSPYTGTIAIQDLRVANGYVDDPVYANGGCINSDTSVLLFQSSIVGCTATSNMGSASGGGIGTTTASSVITLTLSTISGNIVRTSTNASGNARGAGIKSATIQAKYAEIDDNHAFGTFSLGGGTWSYRFAGAYSTVSDNSSDNFGGGVYVRGDPNTTNFAIRNSTFSGNQSSQGGAIFADVGNISVYNSTIVNNFIHGGHGGGLYISATAADIESSIISNNTSTNVSGDADLYLKSGTLTGAHNAIMESNTNPPGLITVGEDPKLAPLAWIGGATRTHGLLPGSPAIGIGSNVANLIDDQRGSGFARASPMTTVDIGAVQFDDRIFVSDFDRFFF